MDDFKKNGHRLYFKDATTREVRRAGLHVYRAFSPDILSLDSLHRYRPLGFPRYYTLADKLKLPRRPRKYDDLNPFPHPFP
jgi:ribosomal protein S12 methylthiotransferase accessory factor